MYTTDYHIRDIYYCSRPSVLVLIPYGICYKSNLYFFFWACLPLAFLNCANPANLDSFSLCGSSQPCFMSHTFN